MNKVPPPRRCRPRPLLAAPLVSVFPSYQYCFCVVKREKSVCNVYKPSMQKVRSAVKMFCSSHGWSCANTDSIMYYCMADHFLCSCEWRYSCGDDKAFCSSQCWSCANCKHRFCNAPCCMAKKHFLCSCLYNSVCDMDHESAIKH